MFCFGLCVVEKSYFVCYLLFCSGCLVLRCVFWRAVVVLFVGGEGVMFLCGVLCCGVFSVRRRFGQTLAAVCFFLAAAVVQAEVPTGSREEAEEYFVSLSKTLKYPATLYTGSNVPDAETIKITIANTTLTDLAAYMGYPTLTAEKLEFGDPGTLAADGKYPPGTLMANGAKPGDVLVSRFFAPKIMNVKFKEGDSDFRLGWRKLIRLKAQDKSAAQINHIASAVILFNTFTIPGEQPYGRGNFSVNTQIMLLPEPAKIRPLPPKSDKNANMDTVYWLDYQNATKDGPGKLGYALNASFDANELPQGEKGRDYFVPHGCVACHANNMQRSLLNYMDTDHWFDRLKTDFPKFRDTKTPLLFDAGTNDVTTERFRNAFQLIQTFNDEADKHAHLAQPKHDETLASAKWLELHKTDPKPVPPVQRAIGPAPQWSAADQNDVAVLETMNQYCYRCHGTVKFSVFNKQATVERAANIVQRLKTSEVGLKMPPDRELPEDKRKQLVDFFLK